MKLKCPNCGAEVGESEAYCSKCGEAMFEQTAVSPDEEKKRLSPATQGIFQALAIALLVIVGLPACAVGGCFLIFSAPGTPASSSGMGLPAGTTWAIGILGIGLFAFLLWLVVRQSRNK